jgi:glycine dehydrogenase subunit 1
MAKDHEGRNGFVLTLQAREQHIRRSKATSNICSNQSLNALCATIYLCLLGKTGMQQQWDLNYQKAHYAFEEICKIPGFKSPWTSSYFFNEFTIECPQPAEKILSVLDSKNILGGYPLSQDYPEIKNGILCCVTEKRTKSEIDQFINTLKQL